MAKPTEEYLRMIVEDIMDQVLEDLAWYLGHEPEEGKEWDEDDEEVDRDIDEEPFHLRNRILNILTTLVDEKWPKRK
jgi:hypothetical protein